MSRENPLPSSLLLLRTGVVLAAALPLALLAAGSWMAHRDAERIAATRLDDLARVMTEHAERALETNAMVFRELHGVLRADTDARIAARAPALQDLLAAICERLPHIRSIAILGADGNILVASGASSGFRVQDARIELSLEPTRFAEFYRRLTKPEDRVSFRLVGADGSLLARWPAAGAIEDTYSASRAVGQSGMKVWASQPPEVVLEPWRDQTLVLSAIALPSAAALLYASLLALRRTRRLLEEARVRAAAEERLRHSQKMDALGELTGGVAHDFGNLLAVVSNAAHVLRARLSSEPKELGAIFRAIKGGERLTRQLLTFARRQPLHPELVDLERALPGMLELLKSTVGSRIALGLHVAPGTPRVQVDPAELEMALINLAANARDAMERAGELEILARPGEPGEGPGRGTPYVVISVSDTGAGIPPENRPRVFDPFFTTKPAGSGTGLGLSQVYGFCQQAGGGVQLESDVGVGTTVSLFLPAAAAVSEAGMKEINGVRPHLRLRA